MCEHQKSLQASPNVPVGCMAQNNPRLIILDGYTEIETELTQSSGPTVGCTTKMPRYLTERR